MKNLLMYINQQKSSSCTERQWFSITNFSHLKREEEFEFKLLQTAHHPILHHKKKKKLVVPTDVMEKCDDVESRKTRQKFPISLYHN